MSNQFTKPKIPNHKVWFRILKKRPAGSSSFLAAILALNFANIFCFSTSTARAEGVTAPTYEIELLTPNGRLREIDGIVTFQWRINPVPSTISLTVFRADESHEPILRRDFVGTQNSFSIPTEVFGIGLYEWEVATFDNETGRVASRAKRPFSIERLTRGYMLGARAGLKFGLNRTSVQTQTSIASAATTLQENDFGATGEWPISERWALGGRYVSRDAVFQGDLVNSIDIEGHVNFWFSKLNKKLRYGVLASFEHSDIQSVIPLSATTVNVQKAAVVIGALGIGADYQINSELSLNGWLTVGNQFDHFLKPNQSLLTHGRATVTWTRLWPIEIGVGVDSYLEKMALGDLTSASTGRDVSTTRSGFGVAIDVRYIFSEISENSLRAP